MPVHDVAAAGFGAGADAYERARPSYPPDAVAWLTRSLRLGPGRVLVDLAAGTGKLTRLLTPTGAWTLAVEPVAGMRRVLRAALPAVAVVAGTAEALPLAGGAVDAVTVAQAFHWFDADAAFAELARVLRPGGRVGLVWNARDRTVGWVDALWSMMDRVERKAPWRDHERWSQSALGSRPGFGPLHTATFRHEQRVTPDGILDRFASVSHVAALPDAERRALLDEIAAVLARHPDTAGRPELAIPYRVDAYWCERR
ncbi:MAG TPA: class I SAM-dependent methyltransferase [Acidimicrobiia bacterium]|jgi:SAM-dependent methyltransferase|nr:class I SAM-dependent methyltransferase [Acidimicrobiia bacterium]